VGPGGSQEAEYTLKADVPAGTYVVQCDAIIIRPVDVTFDLIWRRGDSDTVLATWMEHFEPLPNGQFKAQPYEVEQAAQAIDWQAGDQFIFRYSGANTTSMMAFIPNGDGPLADGRIPNIILPK
jgi:FtsP/CotA-like multicopper oxidase with cupredoxin domain